MGNATENWGGSSKFPGGHKVIHRTAQTAFVRVVTPRLLIPHRLTIYSVSKEIKRIKVFIIHELLKNPGSLQFNETIVQMV